MIAIVRNTSNSFFKAKAFPAQVTRNYNPAWLEETAKECCAVTGCQFADVGMCFLSNELARVSFRMMPAVHRALADYDREFGKKTTARNAASKE